MGIGITEYVVGTIVPQFFRPCLLKILTFSASGSKKLALLDHTQRVKPLYVNAFRFNQ